MIDFLVILFALIVGHMLADFPLQGDYLAKAKARATEFPGVPWYYALFAHSMIHAGIVAIITGSMMCALLELALHACIDFAKNEGEFDFMQDQMAHLVCKVGWALITVTMAV